MKKLAILIVILLCTGFTSCVAFRYDTENIITPPKLTAQQNEIYEALTSTLELPFNLRYPKNGDFRSAFVINNLDSSKNGQAMVFYELKGVSQGEKAVLRINILDNSEGAWVSVDDIEGEGTDVDKILFIDTDAKYSISGEISHRKRFIVIGFYANNVTGIDEKLFKVYEYKNKKFQETYSNTYDILEKCRLHSNDEDELLYISSLTSESARSGEPIHPVSPENLNRGITTANLLRFDGKKLSLSDSVDMFDKVSGYYNISGGLIDNLRPALFLDGLVGVKTYVTEILTVSDGKLENVIYNKNINLINETERFKVINSMEINSDSSVMIPRLYPFPGYDRDDPDAVFYTYWTEYKNDRIEEIFKSYVDIKEGYIFIFPNGWTDNITAGYIEENSEVRFFELNEDLTKGKLLLSIRKINPDETDGLSNGYFRLNNAKNQYLAAKIETASADISVTEKEVRSLFKLIK